MRKISRRELLGGTLAVAAAAALPRGLALAASPDTQQKFRVGHQILSWGRLYPEQWWAACRDLAPLGFKGIEGETTISEVYEGRVSSFVAKMKSYGLELSALYSTSDLEYGNERYENIRKNIQAARFLRDAGGKALVVGGTEKPNPPTDEEYRIMADTGNELGRRAWEEFGVKVAYHPHMGSMIQYREQIGRLMDMTDPRYFFLGPDTGHLLAGNSDPVEVFRTYKTRIAHVHLKDFDPRAPGYALYTAAPGRRPGRMVRLGQGKVDFPALVAILRDADFDGWMNVELDSRTNPAENAELARQYLVNELGLEV